MSYSRLKKIEPEEVKIADKKEKYYPHLTLSLKDLPEAKDWQVGETYTLILEVKQTSLRISRKDDGEVGFDILKVGYEEEEEEDEEEMDDDEENED